MPINWPWSKLRTVPCPDGTTQFVFRNIDHAFPFFFKQAKTSAAAALDGLEKIKGKLEAKYESQIKNILVSIDEKNGSVQAHLRAAYVLYSSAPCKKLDYLERAIENIRQDERDLRAAEIAIRELVALLSNKRGNGATDPAVAVRISEQIGQAVMALNRRNPAADLVTQMGRVHQNSLEWQRL